MNVVRGPEADNVVTDSPHRMSVFLLGRNRDK
jgi:hypothetical protein